MVRASPETIAANRLGQPGLWRFGISGDYPILLVEVDDPKQVDLVREVLQVHKYLRSRRFMLDVVILNRQPDRLRRGVERDALPAGQQDER